MAWIQLIFNTTADKAEPLSDALSACGAAAVTLEDNADQPIYEPYPGQTTLWTATRLTALFDAQTDPEQIQHKLHAMLTEVPVYKVETVENKDWVREWMDQFHPVQFGKRLWICPSWHDAPQPQAINIMLNPGLAFGTGTHPTTALCLNWLDQADLTGKHVIDYGCGSGILAIAAVLLGAEKVIGVDRDPQAIQATKDNAKRNGVKIKTFLPENCPQGPYDVLLANILAGPLQTLAPHLAQLCKPGADIVLSGILHIQIQQVSQAYQPWFGMLTPSSKEDWIRLTGVKRHD